jgi:hypothetical protein
MHRVAMKASSQGLKKEKPQKISALIKKRPQTMHHWQGQVKPSICLISETTSHSKMYIIES